MLQPEVWFQSFFSWSELLELTAHRDEFCSSTAQFLLTLQMCLNLTNTPLLSRTNWRQTSQAAETRLVLVFILNSTALIPSAQPTRDALPSFSFELAQFCSAVLFLHRCFTVKALQAAEIATPGGLLMWNLYRKCWLYLSMKKIKLYYIFQMFPWLKTWTY